MSRTPTAPNPSQGPGIPGGLVPLDAAGGGDKPSGVFRLDSMAPGVENPEQALANPKKARFSTQALVLAGLLVFGGGMIYAMRLVGIGPLSSLAKAPVPDYDVTARAAPEDHKRIIADLSADHAKAQVPLEQVQKNPFRLSDVVSSPASGGAAEDPSKAGAERARAATEAKRRRVEQALAGLTLNGVVGGSRPVARISGEAVRVGDTVGDVFTVKAIHGRSVELESDGQTYTLQMDDETANRNGPKKK